MTIDEEKNYFEDEDRKKVYSSQKIRLYEIKHFIFDFGGVMIEKTFVIKNLFNIIESDLKIKIPRDENSYYRKLFRQIGAGIISSRDFIQKILDKYYYPYQNKEGSLPAKKVNVDYYLELWFQLYSKFANLSTEMEEIVNNLHNGGYIVSLMSNTFDIHARSNELKGFYNLFDHVFLSNEIGLRKPDLEKYKYVLRKLETKPKRCIFVDDKLRNLIPARQLGFKVLKFESIEKFKEQLNQLGIKNIEELSRSNIKNQYKYYKKIKKKVRKAKKDYNKIRKEYLKEDESSLEIKEDIQKKYENYISLKAEYKKAKQIKEDLVSKISFNE